jgi:glycerol-3-phosphate dehydrogenase
MFPSGPLRIELAHNAASRYRRLAEELDVSFKEVGEIFLAFDEEQLRKLENAKRWAEENGVSAGHEFIQAERLWELEPHISRKAIGALYGKNVGGIYAPEWTFALLENAAQNGLTVYLNAPVKKITKKGVFDYSILTSKGRIKARSIINAAGLFADEMAAMVGDDDIHLNLTKGTMAILDKSASPLVRNMVYGTFGKDHSQMVTPTAHGNVLIGLGYFTVPEHKGDTGVSRDKLKELTGMAQGLIPAISEKQIITSFAGIRSENTKAGQGDFHIAPSEKAPGVIHAFVGSPGLTAAPAIAELVMKMLGDLGITTEMKDHFVGKRTAWPRFEIAALHEKEELINRNPSYGKVICRCEQVTEAELLEAIRRGADTMDAIKHLTRAGMGRCQGGFCGSAVLKRLSTQLAIPATQVTKKGEGSQCLYLKR